MTEYRQGDMLLANVFATGLGQFKKRPVVVVGNDMVVDIDVLIAPVTSSAARTSFDIEI
jgi:mRNA interferase MazF